MKLRRIGIGLGLVLVAALLLGSMLMPRLVAFSPSDGSTQVPPLTPIQLTFTQPMLTESVEASLEIEPAWAGEFSWQANTLTFTPSQPWSGGETVRVSLGSGARSALHLPVLGTQTWQFIISRPLVAYLWPLEGPSDLYALDPITGVNQRLTETSGGVLDFDVLAGSGDIVYTQAGGDAGSEIYYWTRLSQKTRRLFDCPQAVCSQVQVSPDGRWLAYLRAAPESQVWLRPLEGGEAVLIGAEQHQTVLPGWSPQGWLSFYDQTEQSFYIIEPETHQQIRIPNETGEPLSWVPDGSAFITSEVILWEVGPPDYSSHLMRYTFPAGQRSDLSQLTSLEDASPVYAPNGRWLAFNRKSLDAAAWTPGRQLWLLRADGGDARQLTNQPAYNFSSFAWSPDGEWLVYLRTKQTALNEPSEIWLVDPFGSQSVRLWIGGYAPQWMP